MIIALIALTLGVAAPTTEPPTTEAPYPETCHEETGLTSITAIPCGVVPVGTTPPDVPTPHQPCVQDPETGLWHTAWDALPCGPTLESLPTLPPIGDDGCTPAAPCTETSISWATSPPPVPPTTVVEPTCTEDMACFDCRAMGNKRCGRPTRLFSQQIRAI